MKKPTSCRLIIYGGGLYISILSYNYTYAIHKSSEILSQILSLNFKDFMPN
jgi:hypothetical protein